MLRLPLLAFTVLVCMLVSVVKIYKTYIFMTLLTLCIDFTVFPRTSSLQGTAEGIHQFRNISQLL